MTGVSETSTNGNVISIYPNPTTSQFTITSSFTIDKIEITDVLGQLIYSATPYDKNCRVDLNREGIYFVTITTGNQVTTKKLVVQQ